MLTADKVLVTIGTPCSVSAVGATETYLARVTGAPEFIAFAAFDAGLIDIDAASDGSLQLRWTNGEPATLADIEQRHGQRLRVEPGHPVFRRTDVRERRRRHRYCGRVAARFRKRRTSQARRPDVSRRPRLRAQGHVRPVRRRPARRAFAASAVVCVCRSWSACGAAGALVGTADQSLRLPRRGRHSVPGYGFAGRVTRRRLAGS